MVNIKSDNAIKFYCMLPDKVISTCISNLNFRNREEKRKLLKIKNTKNCLKEISNKYSNLLNSLSENIYNFFENKIEINNDNYEHIISTYNKENNIYNSIYILHKCFNNKDYYDKYYLKFTKSEQFKKTIYGTWNSNNNKGEKSMKYYLGQIVKETTFYNFEPIYCLENNEIIPIKDVESVFPILGKINLGYEKNSDSQYFLKNLEEKYIFEDLLFAINFDENDLEDNIKPCDGGIRNTIRKKLDLSKLFNNNKNLNDIIKSTDDVKIYEIASADITSIHDLTSNTITPIKGTCPPNNNVLLEFEDNLYGPFMLYERHIDGLKYIKPDFSKNNYILEYYSISGEECFRFDVEIENYNTKESFTKMALLTTKPNLKDIIPDSVLLSKVHEPINTDLLNTNTEEFVRLYSTSPFFKKINKKIKEERLNKIKNIISNVIEYNEEKQKAIIDLIDTDNVKIQDLLISKFKNTKIYKELNHEIQNFKNEIYESNELNDRLIEENQKQIQYTKSLQEENSKLKNNNEEYNISNNIEYIQKMSNIKDLELEKKELVIEIENKKKKIDKLTNKNNLLVDIETLSQRKTKLEGLIDYLEGRKNELQKENDDLEEKKNTLQQQVKTAITNGLKEAKQVENAFDPYISNAMLEAAGKWCYNADNNIYNNLVNEILSIGCKEKGIEDLITYLVSNVQKFRSYTHNEIVNMYICISQSFLTIFSGEPGSGKTSICNILSNSLGLNKFNDMCSTIKDINKNRFVQVPVERGWSSKRDLVGYFNPLTKKYDKCNAKIYDSLMILNKERENSKFPYIILLDEANLSPIEYYWADFMCITDNISKDKFINIGLDNDIYIPETLRFLCTINNDQTTEELSPRLIDRAWIINLPKTDIKEDIPDIKDFFNDYILWSDIKNTFIIPKTKKIQLDAEFNKVCNLFNAHKLTISPRIKQSMKNYISIAQEIMVDEAGTSKAEKALDYAIMQKLLPKINGYMDNYKRLFESLNLICDDTNLLMTKAAISDMQTFADQNMGYCRYLL